MIFTKSIAAVLVLCTLHVSTTVAGPCHSNELQDWFHYNTMSCAGAMDELYGRVSDVKKWCVDPKSGMCNVSKNNCRVAKSECDRICRSEKRSCPQSCP
ncbi:MAG: hypothetical protein BYD32DRAFT_408442 [Podila humilis]|nr:MAG: hypothetical protein BYD32DRAFT_408442 [Podila humilis]